MPKQHSFLQHLIPDSVQSILHFQFGPHYSSQNLASIFLFGLLRLSCLPVIYLHIQILGTVCIQNMKDQPPPNTTSLVWDPGDNTWWDYLWSKPLFYWNKATVILTTKTPLRQEVRSPQVNCPVYSWGAAPEKQHFYLCFPAGQLVHTYAGIYIFLQVQYRDTQATFVYFKQYKKLIQICII